MGKAATRANIPYGLWFVSAAAPAPVPSGACEGSEDGVTEGELAGAQGSQLWVGPTPAGDPPGGDLADGRSLCLFLFL